MSASQPSRSTRAAPTPGVAPLAARPSTVATRLSTFASIKAVGFAVTAVVAAVAVAAIAIAVAGCGATAPQTSASAQLSAPATATSSAAAVTPPVSPAATASPAPSSVASPSAAPTPFAFAVAPLYSARRAAMIKSGSWSPRCPVSLDDLRLLTLTYWGFDGRPHVGRLVVNRDAVAAVTGAMGRLYRARFPIRRMEPVEAYGASDELSMEADNTSAFNGRFVEGSTVWSQHAYGRAIDIDPFENPEIDASRVYPTTATRYVDRSLGLPGMIDPDGFVVRAFAAFGWSWAARGTPSRTTSTSRRPAPSERHRASAHEFHPASGAQRAAPAAPSERRPPPVAQRQAQREV